MLINHHFCVEFGVGDVVWILGFVRKFRLLEIWPSRGR